MSIALFLSSGGGGGGTEPVINNVTGTVATGNLLTVAGSNLIREDTTGYMAEYDANAFSFEGASFNGDGWSDGAGISYISTSGVPLLGSQCGRWAGLQTSNPGGSFGPGAPNAAAQLSATAQRFFISGYFRDDFSYGTGAYGDYHKIWLNYAGNYELNVNWRGTHEYGDFVSGDPYEYLYVNNGGSNEYGLLTRPHKELHWHNVELEVPGASPWTFNVWVDGDLVLTFNGASDPGMAPNGMQFCENTQSINDANYGLEEWIDAFRISTQRIGLLSRYQIGDSLTYATANKKWQYIRQLGDSSAVLECDVDGLTGPYFLYCTNHRGDVSAAYAL